MVVILLLVGAILTIGLVSIKSRASDVTTTVLADTPPSVDSIAIKDVTDATTYNTTTTAIDINPSGTRTIHINGSVSDANGVGTSLASGDLQYVGAKFYTTGGAGVGADCTVDNENCYQQTTCDLTASTSTVLDYSCSIAIQYYADSTGSATNARYSNQHWEAKVMVGDDADLSANSTTQTDVNPQVALTIPTTLSYGTVASGSDSTVASVTIQQVGNQLADVMVKGEALTCTGAESIPLINQKWSLNSAVTYLGPTAGTPLTGTDLQVTDFNLGYGTSAAASPSKLLYFVLNVPSNAFGLCTGHTYITQIAH